MLYIHICVMLYIYDIYICYKYICYIYICYIYIYIYVIYMLCIYICYMYMIMYNIYIYVYTWLHTLDFLVWMQRLLDVLLVSDEKTHPKNLGHNNQLVKSPPNGLILTWSWSSAAGRRCFGSCCPRAQGSGHGLSLNLAYESWNTKPYRMNSNPTR
jgi:hypothetical protein